MPIKYETLLTAIRRGMLLTCCEPLALAKKNNKQTNNKKRSMLKERFQYHNKSFSHNHIFGTMLSRKVVAALTPLIQEFHASKNINKSKIWLCI